MRTVNSLKNVISNFANNILLNILKFITRIIFIKFLGNVYLGVNGLLTNVLGLLALSELGISTAISYNLYKPLKNKDIKTIKSIMNFYRKAYLVIAIIVLTIGIILLPFLPWLIKDGGDINNLNIIYLIFLTNMVIGYLFSYKRTLITADQKNYKITPIIMLSNILLYSIQILIMIVFKNYIFYLLVNTAFVLFENIFVNKYINKEYKYLKEITKEDKLNKKELSSIKQNIKAMFFHKIGGYVFNFTDNLVISKFIGIVMVGIYSNYYLIINMLNSFISGLTDNVVASLGNLLTTDDIKQKNKVFNEMNLICFILYGFCTIGYFALFQPFIELCFGKEYLISIGIVLLMSVNNFIYGMSAVSVSFMVAAGLYYKDRYLPIIQSILNLTISIILVIKIGLAGVVIGTLISNILVLIVKPFLVYKYILKEKFTKYLLDFLKKLIILIIIFGLSAFIINFVYISNLLICIIYRLVLICIIFFIIMYITYRKDKTYLDLINRIKFIIFKK